MKVPANLSGDRLILEYLSRVTVAGTRYLPKGSRIAFVGSTRNRIEREVGPGGTSDPGRVRDVLARLGDPEELVKAERARLDAERFGGQTGGDAGAADLTMPVEHRPINSRWKPATQARPRKPPGQDGATRSYPQPGTGERKRRSRLGGLLWDRPDGPAAPPGSPTPAAPSSPAGQAGQPPEGSAGQPPGGAPGQPPGQPPGRPAAPPPGAPAGQRPWWAGGEAGPAAGGAGSRAPGTQDTGETGPRPAREISARALAGGEGEPGQQPFAGGAAPAPAGDRPAGGVVPIGPVTPVDGTPIPPRAPLTLRAAAITLGHGAQDLAITGVRLARRYPLESAAVVVLGVGGLLYPFPLWLLGGLLTIWSRIWFARDKWVAIAGPPVIAVVGVLVTAVLMKGGMIGNIPRAFHLDFSYLLRFGCLLCAVYLALQARRGPQRRLPPWQRR